MGSSIDRTVQTIRGAMATAGRPPDMAFKMLQLRGLHLALYLHTEQDPSDAEWTAGCQAFRQLRKQCGEHTASLRTLVISDGGAPNTRQRAQFFRPNVGGRHRASVISVALSNPVKRGIATAITWLNPHFRAFEPSHWAEAFAHVGLSQHVDTVWREFAKLQRGLSQTRTLGVIARAARSRSVDVAATG
jgi:hypothetical protein